MRLIWYNRDEFSDQDMIRAKAAADRLLGKKVVQPPSEDLVIKQINNWAKNFYGGSVCP